MELITPMTWGEGAEGAACGGQASLWLRTKEKLGLATAVLVFRAVAALPWMQKGTLFLLQGGSLVAACLSTSCAAVEVLPAWPGLPGHTHPSCDVLCSHHPCSAVFKAALWRHFRIRTSSSLLEASGMKVV